MLTYPVEKNLRISLYEQLYNFIKNDILNKKLKSNEKLPSKRGLAAHLEISLITVESAYGQLMAEGYVYSIEKKGYYVSPVEEFPARPFISEIYKEEQEKQEYFLDFVSNSLSRELFPFTVWSKLLRKTLLDREKSLLSSLSYNGIFELRKAISDYLYQYRGVNANPDMIIIGAGTEYLYNLIIQLLGREKIYAVENPGYPKIAKIYTCNDVICKKIEVDKDGLSVSELLISGADVVHISPSHHFPTGIVMPIARRQELLRWAKENGNRYIIEDDYDSEFRFIGKPIQTLISIDDSEKVIYMNTFSKTLAPSIRISYMVLPPRLKELYEKNLDFYSCTVSSFEQYTLAEFISEGHYERHINKMKNLYRKKRDAVINAFLKSRICEMIEITEENAGLHFLLRISSDKNSLEIVNSAKKQGIRLSAISDYTYGANDSQNVFVINYSGIDEEKLDEGIDKIADIILS